MRLVIYYFGSLGSGMVDSHSVVRHFVGGSKGGSYFTVEDGDGGLHLFFEYFFVVLEKLFEDIVDEVTDAAWRPVSGA